MTAEGASRLAGAAMPLAYLAALVGLAAFFVARAVRKRRGHVYLSTGCLHGHHDYCKSMTGMQGAKRPARCKWCDSPCTCFCHKVAHNGEHD